jgi:hypothetical protein
MEFFTQHYKKTKPSVTRFNPGYGCAYRSINYAAGSNACLAIGKIQASVFNLRKEAAAKTV